MLYLVTLPQVVKKIPFNNVPARFQFVPFTNETVHRNKRFFTVINFAVVSVVLFGVIFVPISIFFTESILVNLVRPRFRNFVAGHINTVWLFHLGVFCHILQVSL